MVLRVLRWLAVALVLVLAVGYAAINLTGHDPDRWHQDPATITLRGTPTEFLAAPPGATQAEPDLATKVRAGTPEELLGRFDRIVRDQPRTEVVAGDVESGMITYVQRTKYIGFPDYVTVKAVPAEAGAALVVYSRSRFGEDDLGVNRQRVKTWLAELGPPEPPEEAPPEAPDEAAGAASEPAGDQPAEQAGGDAAEDSAE